MATILDEMVIRLGIDGTQFSGESRRTQDEITKLGAVALREARLLEEFLRRTQDATNRRMHQTSDVGRQVSQQFSNVKNNVLGFLGTIAGAYGLQQFVSNIIHADAALGNFAKTLGIDPALVATWEEMGKRVGSSIESVRSAFVAYNKIKTDIQITGTSAAIPALQQIGVQIQDPKTGQIKEASEFLKDLGEAAKNHPAGIMREVLGGIGFAPDILPLLQKGRVELTQLEAAMRAQGVASAKSAEQDQQFLNRLADLQQIVKDVGRTILGDLLVPMGKALDQLKAWTIANREWIATNITESFRQAVPVIREIAEAIEKVVGFLGGWKNTAEIILGLWVASKVAPILAFVVDFTKLVWGATSATAALGMAMGKLAMPAWFAGFLRFLPALAALGFLGPAGGEDSEFSNQKMDEYLKNKYGPDYKNNPEYLRLRSGGGTPGTFEPAADMAMPTHRRAFLDALSIGESRGSYSSQNPESSAHGRYQFINKTDAEISAATGLPGEDPVSQDRKGWFLASRTYRAKTGRDLDEDVKSGDRDMQIADALKETWPSLPGGSQRPMTSATWLTRMREGRARYSTPGMQPSLAPAPVLPTPPLPPPAASTGATTNNTRTSSVETHVNGPITVHTAATDATGVARGLGAALQRYAYVPQVNAGLA